VLLCKLVKCVSASGGLWLCITGVCTSVPGIGSRMYSATPGSDVKYRNGSVAIGNALFGPSVFASPAFAKRWVTWSVVTTLLYPVHIQVYLFFLTWILIA